MMHAYDVVVIGGGMVGLGLACSLGGSALRVAVIDTQGEQPLAPGSTGSAATAQMTPDLRVSALSLASRRMLEQLGAWQYIAASGRLGPYRTMEVWERDGFGQTRFDAADTGSDLLGHIVENRVIRQALWQQASHLENVRLLAPARCQQVHFGEHEAFLTLDNGQMLSARLVVGADGARSWLRQQADIPLTSRDYGHHALVATVRTELPHDGCARQCFQPSGPLALLPLWQKDLCSIVWSLPPEQAEELLNLPAEAFNRRLTVAFDHRLGRLALETGSAADPETADTETSDSEAGVGRQSLPLTMRYARQFAAHRVALIGDAAHTIHPLAGQGVNLGLEDARELAAVLRQLSEQGQDPGLHRSLRQWERARKSAAAEMIAAMEGFKRLYGNAQPAIRLVRNAGMQLADRVAPLRRALIQKALGFSKQDILRGFLPFG